MSSENLLLIFILSIGSCASSASIDLSNKHQRENQASDALGITQASISDAIGAYNRQVVKKISGMAFMTVPDGLTRSRSEMGRGS